MWGREVQSFTLHPSFPLPFRAAVDRRPAAGGGGAGGGQGGIASEQLQPLYDVKNVVGQQSDQLTALSQQIQVRPYAVRWPFQRIRIGDLCQAARP